MGVARNQHGVLCADLLHDSGIFSFRQSKEWRTIKGLEVDIKTANSEVHFYSGGEYRSTVIYRSMEKPGSIVGFKIGKALVDELDVMPMHKAEHAWRKIINAYGTRRMACKTG